MADNLNTLEGTIDSKITNAGGPGSILAADHNSILKEVLQKTGKYTGVPFKARKEPSSGVVPTGVFFFNSNALNTTTDFVVTTSKITADLNDFGYVLGKMKPGDLFHFKDYFGRSAYFVYKSHTASQDSNNSDTYEITISGVNDNPNYSYQSSDDAVCVLESVIGNASQEIINVGGVDYIYRKKSSNGTATVPQQYDVAEFGVREITEDGDTFNVVQTLMYNTGTPADLSSWEIIQENEISF